MTVFPDEHHLCSWTGICPGNEESAGKRLRSRTRKGNRWLRRALTEAAWAASHTKDSYLAAQYRRLAARRGKKRALLAVGHSILVIIYHLLKHDVEYQDLGADFFDRLEPDRLRRYLVRRLQRLGYDVTLTSHQPDPPPPNRQAPTTTLAPQQPASPRARSLRTQAPQRRRIFGAASRPPK